MKYALVLLFCVGCQTAQELKAASPAVVAALKADASKARVQTASALRTAALKVEGK